MGARDSPPKSLEIKAFVRDWLGKVSQGWSTVAGVFLLVNEWRFRNQGVGLYVMGYGYGLWTVVTGSAGNYIGNMSE